jgi:hypothetical protein
MNATIVPFNITSISVSSLVISGFRGGGNEISFFWDVTRRKLVVIYRRFGTSYHSHFQESSIPRPLKMGPIGCPETSVSNYQYTRPNIPEVQRSNPLPSIIYLRSREPIFFDKCSLHLFITKPRIVNMEPYS